MNSVMRFFIIGALSAALAGTSPITFPNLPLLSFFKPLSTTILHLPGPSSDLVRPWAFLRPILAGEAPTALDDTYAMNEDVSLTVPVPGLLANDTDPETDPLNAILVDGPAHGDLTLEPDGSFQYTSALNFSGIDTFTYTAADGTGISSPATVTLTIAAVNDPPVALDDEYSVSEDGSLIIPAPGPLANDTDVENDPLTAFLEDGQGPAHGELALNADGSFLYTPTPDYAGADSFQYRATDGQSNSIPATVVITVTPVNDPPITLGDAHSVSEDGVLSVPLPGILANDTDIEGDLLVAILDIGPTSGSLTLEPDGSFIYTPDPDFAGEDTFTYHAADTEAGSVPADVSLTVTPVNDAPTGAGEAYATAEDTPLVRSAPGVLANDTDIDGDSLTAVLDTAPSNGQLILNPDGSFTYTPDLDFSGQDSFLYSITDGQAQIGPFSADLTITPVNDVPIAAADSYVTAEDTPFSVVAPGILANDTDPDGPALTALLITGPANGDLVFDPGGSFTYTPDLNFHGADSFSYQASDGLVSSAITTVSITVTPVNDPPLAAADSATTPEDTPFTSPSPGLLSNDTDAEAQPLFAVLVVGPTHGSLALDPDGSFTYTPDPDFNGADSFTYRASDGSFSSEITAVTLTIIPVNDAPLAVADHQTLAEDETLSVPTPGVLANDTDVDSDPLSAVLVTGPSHGALTLNPGGSYQYTPAADYHGADSFMYQADDGDLTSTPVTVTLIITPINDPPTAAPDAYSTAEDTPLALPALGLLANDSDVDADTLSAVLVDSPTGGSLALAADGSFTYIPDPNFNGSDTFTYQASDGALASLPAVVSITVTPVNDAPVGVADSFTTAEDIPLSVAAPGILANDTDIENDPLTAALVSLPQHGTLALLPDGSFTYSPSANYNGTDSFTYSARDADSTSLPVTIDLTITPVNDAPVAAPDAYPVAEDDILSISAPGILANDADIETGLLTAALVAPPQHGTLTLSQDGSFIYTPNADYNGPDSFTYTAHDALSSSEAVTVSLSITPVNDAPVAAADEYTTSEDTALSVPAPGLLINDTDIEDDALSVESITLPAHGTLVLDLAGSFSYTPAADYHGPDSFTYQTLDAALASDPVLVALTVTPVNDAPIAAAQAVATDEDTPLTITLSGTDVDGDPLTYAPGAPIHGTLTLVSPGGYTYTPDPDYFGPDSFTFTAHDAVLPSSSAAVTINVLPINDAPIGIPDDTYTIAEDTTLTISTLDGVLTNDSDIEANPLSAVLSVAPSHGALVLDPDGSFQYTPAADYYGTDTFSYYASDGLLSSALTTATITITNVNDAPVAFEDAYTTGEDNPLTLDAQNGLRANDHDVDLIDTLTVILDAGPAHGTLDLETDGSFVYTPGLNYYGPDEFSYHLSDGNASSAVRTVSLTINAINDVPTAQNDTYSVSMGGILTVDLSIGLLNNDTDIEDDSLQALILTHPVNQSGVPTGLLIDDTLTDGTFTYHTYPNLASDVTFTYAVTDGEATSQPATVTVKVVRPTGIQVVWDSPVEKKFSNQSSIYWVGNETIELRAHPVDCPTDHCGIRYFRFDPNETGQARFKHLALVEQPPYIYLLNTSVLNDGWNEIMALAYDTADPQNPDLEITDQFKYRAYDGMTYSEPATAMITVVSGGGPDLVAQSTDNSTDTQDGSAASDLPAVPLAGIAPIAVNDFYTTPPGAMLTVDAPGLLANDTDPEAAPLTASIDTPPLHGSVTIRPDGSFDYIFPVGASPRLSIFLRRFPTVGPLPRLYLPNTRH